MSNKEDLCCLDCRYWEGPQEGCQNQQSPFYGMKTGGRSDCQYAYPKPTLCKRIAGMLYGVLLPPLLSRIGSFEWRMEHEYLSYCRNGCENCYKWRCSVRSEGKTPYKKFRRGKVKK